mmetsp:Transcript_116861/g.308755  ORF Transcript_116861/g.308755 Transcript_116861/m.308755 type:complete len:271 (-) Transcript_116861:69-881(-)
MLLLQPFDQVQIGRSDLVVINLDLGEVLRILPHDLLDLRILRLLDLLNLLATLLLHLVADALHPQLVLLLHVSGLPVVLLPQLQDSLVLLQLQGPDEIILGNFGLFFLDLQRPLVLLDLRLCHTMVVLLKLQRRLRIRLQLHHLVLLVVPQVLQPLLEHLQLNLLPLLQVLVLPLLVPQVGLLLRERLLLYDPEIDYLLSLHQELLEVVLLHHAALPQPVGLLLVLLPLPLLLLGLLLLRQLLRADVLALLLPTLLPHCGLQASWKQPPC